MLRFLRRSRLVPLLLLLAMPGVGGTLVQAGHHCATEAPWAATAVADAGEHAGHGPGVPAAPDGSGHSCDCIGSCHSPATAAGPAGMPAIAHAEPEPAFSGPAVGRADAPRPRPSRLLPPANAPPLG